MIIRKTLLTVAVALSLNLHAAQSSDTVQPEVASGYSQNTAVTGRKYMMAAANPLAAQAGYEVLAAGGRAIDAMVAAQAVLGLVEPQSSGLGGGAFVVYYDASKQQVTTFDGRETAPMAAYPELFQDEQGKPLKFYEGVVGGRSVGIPGVVKLMTELHSRYGTVAWAQLLKPAAKLAFEGFPISPRLAVSIDRDQERLSRYPDTKAYFFNADGEPLVAGDILKNPEYAQTLATLARKGAAAFYSGEIGNAIVSKVRGLRDNPGLLRTSDLENYRIKERPPVCAPYRQYEICGMGPPSSGALTIGQIMGITTHFDLKGLGQDNPEAWQIIGDASRLAFADRGRYMADTDYVPLPDGLLDPTYLSERARLITPGTALTNVTAGEPRWEKPVKQADDQSLELPSTTHMVIVDSDGNTLSMTSSVENSFGSRVMSNGFLLNNVLTDFSFTSFKDGYPIANRVEPGKRPRSSMSPTIVMKDGKPYLAIGSPGGANIINYVATTLIRHLEWGMPIQDAINAPHLQNRFGVYDLEKGNEAEQLKAPLEAMGYKVNIRDMNSGIQAIKLQGGTLTGAADPRREGAVMGD